MPNQSSHYICPICSSKKVKYDVGYVEGFISEEHIKCPRCNYQADFAYGSMRIKFADHDWVWFGYEDSSEDRVASIEARAAEKEYSKFWKFMNEIDREHTEFLKREKAGRHK
jgi:hypothetical protein